MAFALMLAVTASMLGACAAGGGGKGAVGPIEKPDDPLAPYKTPVVMNWGWGESPTVKYGEGESMTDNRWIKSKKTIYRISDSLGAILTTS